MSPRVKVITSVGAVLAFCLASHPVWAGGPASLRDFLFGSRPSAYDALPTIARYKADGGQGFVFDRTSGHGALVKFDDSAEILALTATQGPRGDVIYKNDVGQPVLRATRLGGLTVFTNDYPGGMAAAPTGVAVAPRPPPILGPVALLEIVTQASLQVRQKTKHFVYFDAGDANVTPEGESVFADAFILAADALIRVNAHGKAGQGSVQQLSKVRFLQGAAPDVAVIGSSLQITVAPQLGIAGRPSSKRIALTLLRR
jgi:Domain of unknown function (DUF4908)